MPLFLLMGKCLGHDHPELAAGESVPHDERSAPAAGSSELFFPQAASSEVAGGLIVSHQRKVPEKRFDRTTETPGMRAAVMLWPAACKWRLPTESFAYCSASRIALE